MFTALMDYVIFTNMEHVHLPTTLFVIIMGAAIFFHYFR